MKLYYYRGAEPNFGDELNNWLIPKVLPDVLDSDESHMLLGIGSVLYDSHPAAVKKTVFGTGWGGYTPPPKLDDSWDVYCVRGPLTAQALNLPLSFVAGDAAILVRDYYTQKNNKHFKTSFIPHFESIARGQWQAACAIAGIHFIDPRLPVTEVLDLIGASEVVITEAMHGAIVSDALRVPWIAVTPFDRQHHMKWNDWAGALDLEVRFNSISPSSARERYLARNGEESWHLQNKSGWRPIAAKPVDVISIGFAALALSRTARVEPQLSTDFAILSATEKLQIAAMKIAKKYRKT